MSSLRLAVIVLGCLNTAWGAASTTTLSVSEPGLLNTASPVTFLIVITGSSAHPATGLVTLQEAGSDRNITAGTAVNGQATLRSFLSAGPHTLIAFYGGNAELTSSTSNTLAVNVNKATPSVTVTSSKNPSTWGEAVLLTFRTTVPLYAPRPSGRITILEDGVTTSTVGFAEEVGLSLRPSPGAHTYTFTLAGDSNYQAASASITQTVNNPTRIATAVSLRSSANPSAPGGRVILTATVTAPGTPRGTFGPKGTVQFRSGATVLCATQLIPSLDAMGTAECSSSPSPGRYSIVAEYTAESPWTSSASAPLLQVYTPGTPLASSTALTSSANPAAYRQTIVLQASVVGNNGTPTGTVSFLDGDTTLGGALLSADGKATLATTAANAGTRTFAAVYSGDALYAPSRGALAVVVNKAATATSLRSSANQLKSGEPVTLTAAVTSPLGTPTGTVTFLDGSTTVGTAFVTTGTAALTLTPAAGTHTFGASYGGDGNFAASSASVLAVTVARGAITLTTPELKSGRPVAGQPMVLECRAIADGVVPTGMVTFQDGSRTIGSALLSGGAAQLTVSTLGAGVHGIAASYAGDANYPAASSGVLTLTIGSGAQVTLAENIAADGPVLTATVTGGSGGSPVEFRNLSNGELLGTATPVNGQATLAISRRVEAGQSLLAATEGAQSAPIPFVAALNGLSFRYGNVAPDEIVAAFGTAVTGLTAAAPAGALPTTLADVSAQVTGADGASYVGSLFYASPEQVNFVAPSAMPVGSAKLTVTGPRGSYTVGITIAGKAPGLASADGSGTGFASGQALRYHADRSVDDPVTISDAPIAFGTATDRLYLVLYGTGFRHAAGAVTCTIGNSSLTAAYAGPQGTYAGLDQINLAVPDTLRGLGVAPLACTADGATSNTVKLRLE